MLEVVGTSAGAVEVLGTGLDTVTEVGEAVASSVELITMLVALLLERLPFVSTEGKCTGNSSL